jgi:hypothetical protein
MKSQRHEALRRLGAPLVVCPTCMTSFRADRFPRHWVHAYFEGELIEHEDDDDLCCSGTCATDRCNKLSQNEEENEEGTLVSLIRFTYYREEAPQ